jgi:hypothetical protein
MNLLQGDVHQVVLPILPEAHLPQIEEVGRGLAGGPNPHAKAYLVDLVIADTCDYLYEGKDNRRAAAAIPGWTLLRRIGGEIVEVAVYAADEEIKPGWPILTNGRFESGCLFRALYEPAPFSSPGRAELAIHVENADPVRVQLFGQDPINSYMPLVFDFERAVARLKTTPRAAPGAGPVAGNEGAVSWQDEIRALELDDAARRSIANRRVYTLEYQEASEDVGFKGTMTLVGCALIWLIPVLLVVAAWFPLLGWVIFPVLLGFLGLQLLRWLVSPPAGGNKEMGDASQKQS